MVVKKDWLVAIGRSVECYGCIRLPVQQDLRITQRDRTSNAYATGCDSQGDLHDEYSIVRSQGTGLRNSEQRGEWVNSVQREVWVNSEQRQMDIERQIEKAL